MMTIKQTGKEIANNHQPQSQSKLFISTVTASLFLFVLNGCQGVSQSEYDTMKQGLENTIAMTILVGVILCILIGLIALFIGNIMGSKTLKDSKNQAQPGTLTQAEYEEGE